MIDHLAQAFPRLAERLPKMPLANLPTPVAELPLSIGEVQRSISIKYDDRTSELYGGNKVRKLEYILQRARDRDATRVATFGTVASNHALATAVYGSANGFECTCFLSHQTRTPKAALTLELLLNNDAEIVCYPRERPARVRTLREHLWDRQACVIPMGGSSWLGVIGFVNAGLELAGQVAAGLVPAPDQLYVANGTMGTTAGLALGLALAGLRTEIQAIRVTPEFVANPAAMQRLIEKSVTLMRRLDASIPVDLGNKVRLSHRDEFFGKGYAYPSVAADNAINVARRELNLELDATYTGKAMAALLHDIQQPAYAGQSLLFWNTYNSRPLPAATGRPEDTSGLPEEFLRYFD